MPLGKQTTIYIKADELEAIQKLCKEHNLKAHHVLKLALRYFLFNERFNIPLNGFHASVEEVGIPCSPELLARAKAGEVFACQATSTIDNSGHTERRMTIVPEKKIEIISDEEAAKRRQKADTEKERSSE
jgi:hypothetical protein